MEATEFYQRVTERVIEALERGTAPWTRPWRTPEQEGPSQPVNAVTGRPYQGVNALTLALHTLSLGTTDMRFATFKQAKEKGWGIRRGASGLPVIKLVSPRPFAAVSAASKGDLHEASHKGGEGEEIEGKEPIKEGSKRFERLIPRIYYVFSSADMVGIPPFSPGKESEVPRETLWGESERTEKVRTRLSEGMGVAVHHEGHRAFYNRERDEVTLPPEEIFEDCGGYLGTLFHEFAHATGHEKRLNRVFGRWGEESYAFEELVAEISSLFVGMRTGISPDERHFENHAAYVGHWTQTLRNDRKALVRAATLAQSSCDLLLTTLTPSPKEKLPGEEYQPLALE